MTFSFGFVRYREESEQQSESDNQNRSVERTTYIGRWERCIRGNNITLEKEDDNSIDTQVALIQDYIMEHPELELADTYIDHGYTGTNFDRPDFIRLMEDYGMGFDDQTIAQMVKCYLKSLPQTQAKRLLGRAVNPKIIDLARKNCQEEMDLWDGSGRLCKRTKCFIEDEIIAQNPGEVYVKGMPVEFAEFLLDCYFRVKAG